MPTPPKTFFVQVTTNGVARLYLQHPGARSGSWVGYLLRQQGGVVFQAESVFWTLTPWDLRTIARAAEWAERNVDWRKPGRYGKKT